MEVSIGLQKDGGIPLSFGPKEAAYLRVVAPNDDCGISIDEWYAEDGRLWFAITGVGPYKRHTPRCKLYSYKGVVRKHLVFTPRRKDTVRVKQTTIGGNPALVGMFPAEPSQKPRGKSQAPGAGPWKLPKEMRGPTNFASVHTTRR